MFVAKDKRFGQIKTAPDPEERKKVKLYIL